MKKLAIVGASLAFAALPVVGVFADNPAAIVDTIQVTVGETCTFNSSNSGDKTYTLSMSTNDLQTTPSSSTFTAVCNNATGFYVSATPTAISGTGEAITYSATTPTAGSGTWTATIAEEGNIAATGGILMTANSATSSSGVVKTVNYTVSTRNNQAKGSYSGTMTYQLTQNS